MLTLRNYTADIKRFEEWISSLHGETKTVESAVVDDIRLYIIHRVDDEAISNASINRELATLRSLYRWALGRGYVDQNPMRSVQPLKVAKRLPHFIPRSKIGEVITPPSQAEATAPDWEAYRSERNAMILIMLYYTGLRLSEIASLKSTSFNASWTSFRVVGKGGKEREIPVASAIRPQLNSYVQKLLSTFIWIRSDFYLFLTNRASPLSSSSIYKIVRQELKKCGVQGKKSPHVMRHTFATHLLSGGAEIRVIQELLGHSSLRATQRYTHNSISSLKRSYTAAHPRGGQQGAEGAEQGGREQGEPNTRNTKVESDE